MRKSIPTWWCFLEEQYPVLGTSWTVCRKNNETYADILNLGFSSWSWIVLMRLRCVTKSIVLKPASQATNCKGFHPKATRYDESGELGIVQCRILRSSWSRAMGSCRFQSCGSRCHSVLADHLNLHDYDIGIKMYIIYFICLYIFYRYIKIYCRLRAQCWIPRNKKLQVQHNKSYKYLDKSETSKPGTALLGQLSSASKHLEHIDILTCRLAVRQFATPHDICPNVKKTETKSGYEGISASKLKHTHSKAYAYICT